MYFHIEYQYSFNGDTQDSLFKLIEGPTVPTVGTDVMLDDDMGGPGLRVADVTFWEGWRVPYMVTLERDVVRVAGSPEGYREMLEDRGWSKSMNEERIVPAGSVRTAAEPPQSPSRLGGERGVELRNPGEARTIEGGEFNAMRFLIDNLLAGLCFTQRIEFCWDDEDHPCVEIQVVTYEPDEDWTEEASILSRLFSRPVKLEILRVARTFAANHLHP